MSAQIPQQTTGGERESRDCVGAMAQFVLEDRCALSSISGELGLDVRVSLTNRHAWGCYVDVGVRDGGVGMREPIRSRAWRAKYRTVPVPLDILSARRFN